MNEVFTIEFPPAFELVLEKFEIFSFDLNGLLGTPCLAKTDSIDNFIIKLFQIVGFVVFLLLIFTIIAMRKKGYCPKFCGGRLEKVAVVKVNKLRRKSIAVLRDINSGVKSPGK